MVHAHDAGLFHDPASETESGLRAVSGEGDDPQIIRRNALAFVHPLSKDFPDCLVQKFIEGMGLPKHDTPAVGGFFSQDRCAQWV